MGLDGYSYGCDLNHGSWRSVQGLRRLLLRRLTAPPTDETLDTLRLRYNNKYFITEYCDHSLITKSTQNFEKFYRYFPQTFINSTQILLNFEHYLLRKPILCWFNTLLFWISVIKITFKSNLPKIKNICSWWLI